MSNQLKVTYSYQKIQDAEDPIFVPCVVEKTLFILRGLPGSGKSTVARKILEFNGESQVSHCSTDKFWMQADGSYVFDHSNLRAGHAACEMAADRSMANGILIVVVDNTNIRRDNFKSYLDMATKYGYSVREIVVGDFSQYALDTYKSRQIHNVPDHVYERMIRDFEP